MVELARDVELYNDCLNYEMLIQGWKDTLLKWRANLDYELEDVPIAKVTIVFGQDDSPLHVVGAYPSEHLKGRGSLILPAKYKAYGAVAIQHSVSQEHFAVVIGFMSSFRKPRNSQTKGLYDTEWNYWLMPMDYPEYGTWRDQTFQSFLKAFCDRVSKFEFLDYFERSTKRQDSCKCLHLSTGERIIASVASVASVAKDFVSIWVKEWAQEVRLVLHIEHNKNLTRAIKPL